MKKSIDSQAWYSARDTASLLDGEINELTVKKYCREGKLRGRKKGARQEWKVPGSEILRLRRKWDLDS